MYKGIISSITHKTKKVTEKGLIYQIPVTNIKIETSDLDREDYETISQGIYNYLFANETMIFDKISFVIGGRYFDIGVHIGTDEKQIDTKFLRSELTGIEIKNIQNIPKTTFIFELGYFDQKQLIDCFKDQMQFEMIEKFKG